MARTVHIVSHLWPTVGLNENRLNFCMGGGRSARLLSAHRQCVAGACSSVWGPGKHSWSGWWLMSTGQLELQDVGEDDRQRWKHFLPVCNYRPTREFSWSRIQGVPESDSEATFWKSGAARLILKLDIVDGTVNVTRCIGILLKSMVPSA